MKKFSKWIVILAMMIVAVFAFSACGSDSVVGKWEFESFVATGNVAGADVSISFNADNMTEEHENSEWGMFAVMEFEFRDDGTVISTMSEEPGQYRMDGNKIISLNEDGTDEEVEEGDPILELKNGKIVMSVEMFDMAVTVTFRKV